MNRVVFLENPVMNYAWGSRTAIPELLGRRPDPAVPEAELWMGAHPKAPSTVVLGKRRLSLEALIRERPVEMLGAETARRFGNRLPYLFKVLAAERALSIQAHPSREQAQAGFRRENAAGLAPDAPERNYRDASHKPECICALTPFWALRGFRSVGRIAAAFEAVFAVLPGADPAAERLKRLLVEQGLKAWFAGLMKLGPDSRRRLVDAAVRHAAGRSPEDPLRRWLVRLHDEHPHDIGVLGPLFLNLVRLAPGEAMFLPSGELHAYLDGTGIELMANSDNVLRGGLTAKHVDVPELLEVLDFSEGEAAVVRPRPAGPAERVYPSAAAEFELSVIRPDGGVYRSGTERGIEILLCTGGAGRLEIPGRGEPLPFGQGSCLLVPAAAPAYEVRGGAILYKASVPHAGGRPASGSGPLQRE